MKSSQLPAATNRAAALRASPHQASMGDNSHRLELLGLRGVSQAAEQERLPADGRIAATDGLLQVAASLGVARPLADTQLATAWLRQTEGDFCGGIDAFEADQEALVDRFFSPVEGVPVVGGAVEGLKGGMNFGREMIYGAAKGAISMASGLAQLAVDPASAARGIYEMYKHTPTGYVLTGGQALLDAALGNRTAAELGDALNPLTAAHGDLDYWCAVGGALAKPYVEAWEQEKYGEIVGRGGFEILSNIAPDVEVPAWRQLDGVDAENVAFTVKGADELESAPGAARPTVPARHIDENVAGPGPTDQANQVEDLPTLAPPTGSGTASASGKGGIKLTDPERQREIAGDTPKIETGDTNKAVVEDQALHPAVGATSQDAGKAADIPEDKPWLNLTGSWDLDLIRYDAAQNAEKLRAAFPKNAVEASPFTQASQVLSPEAYYAIVGARLHKEGRVATLEEGIARAKLLPAFADNGGMITHTDVPPEVRRELTMHEMVHNAAHPAMRSASTSPLNEGITQMITENLLGPGVGAYAEHVAIVREMVQKVGMRAIEDAYFNGELQELYATLERAQPGSAAALEARLKAAHLGKPPTSPAASAAVTPITPVPTP